MISLSKKSLEIQYLGIIGFILILVSCSPVNSQKKVSSAYLSDEFKEYWYAGKAELNRFELKQVRYGEIHPGEAVLIFVTEEINAKTQIKYEGGDRKDVVPILKLNYTKKFFTGIYPYSLMSSVFTPVNNASSYKVSASAQEWCGHSYAQLNLKDQKYQGLLHSYFQNEGDQEYIIPAGLLEDELWNKIRLDPSALPTGKIKIFPGTLFQRLKHVTPKIHGASASIEEYTDPALSAGILLKYSLVYDQLDRALSISFEKDFPHAIVAWEEKEGPLKTQAIRTNVVKSAYWSQHDLKDAKLRSELGLSAGNY